MHQIGHQDEDRRRQSAHQPLGPMQYGVDDDAVLHHHIDAARHRHHQGHPDEIPRPVEEGRHVVGLRHPVDEGNQDGGAEEEGGELVEPPAQGGQQINAQIRPGHHRIDHQQEGAEEDQHGELLLAAEGEVAALHLGELVVINDIGQHGAGLVLLHLPGVAHHEPGGEDHQQQPLDDP